MVTPPVFALIGFALIVLGLRSFVKISWGVAIALIVAYSIIGTTVKNQIK